MLGVAAVTPTLSADDDLPPLFPFVISYDGPDNASSMAYLLDAPAGKHGFVRVKDGRFVDDAGPVRLHATNLTGPANFPTREQADKLAARLARFGINCVRLHYMDEAYGNFMTEKVQGIIADDPATQRNLDPRQLEKLDYLIAALKKRGIYVDINLHVARWWDDRDSFPARDKRPGFDKGLDNFEPRMIDLQKEYARKLLTHVNPYTGLAYTDDPCVAVIEINNENSLFSQYHAGGIDRLPEPYAGEFRRQWNEWLRKKYPSTTAMLEAWKWQPTPLGNEQIPEGQFAQPLAIDGRRWILARGSSEASCSVAGGVLKLVVTRDGEEFFPKLFRNLSVKKGQPYTLSFKIRCAKGTPDAALGLAVADAKGGWRSLGVHQTIHVGSAWRTFAYAFAAGDDSDKAQFQLTRFKVGTYEIADVSFQSGAKSDLDPTARIENGTIRAVRTTGFVPLEARRDFYQFLVDTERAYWTGMAQYLKHDLKAKSVISGTQLGYSPPHVQADLDYIDNHSYWCHPSPVSKDWRIGNVPMVNSMSCILGLAGQRVDGKPYTVSEYNHPFPNQYGAEGQVLLRAYGALQGWDGVFEYTYNHSPNFEPDRNTYFFSIIARTDVLAQFPACAAMFLRGDVREAKSTIIAPADYPAYFERLVASRSVGADIGSAGFDPRQALLHKTAVDVSGKWSTDPASVAKLKGKLLASDTGELTWSTEVPEAAYFAVNAPNTKLFTGFPHGRTIQLGEVTLAIGRTRLDWATVSLVSRQATGFGQSGRPASILVAATGVAENKGMVIEQVNAREITLHDRWGSGPVCVEGVPATITLPADPATTKCFALDPSGNRKKSVPVEKGEGSGSRIILAPEYETVWYEIDVSR
jgi:ribosomal protein S6